MISVNFNQLKISTIVSISAYIAGILCIVAVSGQISFFYPLLLLAMMALSAYLEIKGIFIPRWLLTVFSVAVVIYFILQISKQDLIEQVMEALFVLLGIKFLEQKQVRDFMQIYALTLFVLAGLGLLTLSMAFILYLLVFFILLSLSLVFLTFYSQDPNMELTNHTIRKMVVKCLWIPLLAIPLSSVMFVILPRTHYPILTFLNRPDRAKTGFTDNVRLGHVSDIQEDESILFRATMERIDDRHLYWRGITLDLFNGTSWRRTNRPVYSNITARSPGGRQVKQTIYLEPYQNSYVFALDKPVFVDLRRIKKNDDLTFTMPGFIDKRVRYNALSMISRVIPEENSDMQPYLQLPEGLSPKIISLAKSLAIESGKEDTLQNIYDHMHSGRYGYSLTGLPETKNPLEHFLFKTRFGNCEYFASAMAVMLRVNGIPSRLVGGYRGGYYNDMGSYYLVPQKNAHVWIEAYVAGQGWVRFDPTPASPEEFARPGKGVLMRLRLFFDTINYYWYGIVLTYNLEKQISIARGFVRELKKPSLSFSFHKWKVLKYFGFLVLGLALAILAWSFIAALRSSEERIMSAFMKKLKDAGYTKDRSQGLEEFLSAIADENLRRSALEFAREFENIYYRDRRFTAEDLKKLRELVKALDRV